MQTELTPPAKLKPGSWKKPHGAECDAEYGVVLGVTVLPDLWCRTIIVHILGSWAELEGAIPKDLILQLFKDKDKRPKKKKKTDELEHVDVITVT